jgi:hypothetical protein
MSSFRAFGINNQGQIVGDGLVQGGGLAAALYWASPTAGPMALRIPASALMNEVAFARGINDQGQIVGEIANKNYAPYSWVNFISFPTAIPAGSAVYAHGINNAGQIVGDSDFWQSATSNPSTLSSGSFGGGVLVYGINNQEKIVGCGFDNSSLGYAVLWSSPTADPVALPSGTFGSTCATGINDKRQVVGFATMSWPAGTSPAVPLYWLCQ